MIVWILIHDESETSRVSGTLDDEDVSPRSLRYPGREALPWREGLLPAAALLGAVA